MSSTRTEKRRSTTLERVVVVAWATLGIISAILILVPGLPSKTSGGPPTKIATLGNLQVAQLPVSRKAKTWFTKVRQKGRSDALTYQLWLADGTEFLQPYNSRPSFLIPLGLDGDALFFCVDNGGEDLLYRQASTLGPPDQITTSNSNKVKVLAAVASDTDAYFLTHTDTAMAVYHLVWDQMIAVVMPGSEVVADSVPTDGFLVRLSDGIAFDYPSTGALDTVRRVIGTTPHDFVMAGVIAGLHASGDRLHATVASTHKLYHLSGATVEPVVTGAGNELIMTPLAPTSSGNELVAIARVVGVEGVYRVMDASANEIPFVASSTGVVLQGVMTDAAGIWALAKIIDKTRLWLDPDGSGFQKKFPAGALDTRELAHWDVGAAFAAGTSGLFRYALETDVGDYELLPTGVLVTQVWSADGTIYAIGDENGGVGSPDLALYSW